MEHQQQRGNLPAKANVKLTRELLNSVEYSTQILDLPAVRDNWISTYKKTSGRTDGELRFEGEKVMLMQLISGSSALQQASRESLYGVWIELALSGLTLRDGLCYVIPRSKKATFQVGWKGRLEQITQMPQVIHVQEPQVVYSCDDFKYEKGMETKIHKHVPMYPRPEGSRIHFVYMVIHFTYGIKVYMMDADEVLNIRDNFSDSYKQYLKDLPNVVNGKITKSGQNGTYTKDFEAPMWVTNEAQAFRKTLVKRVYNNMDKLPHQKYLDDRMAAMAADDGIAEEDIDEVANQYNYEDAFKMDEGGYTDAEVVDTTAAVQDDRISIQEAEKIEQQRQAQQAQQAQQNAAPAQQQAAQPAQPKTGGRAQTQPTNTAAQPAQQQQPAQPSPNHPAGGMDNGQPGGDLFGGNTPPPTVTPNDIGDPNEAF